MTTSTELRDLLAAEAEGPTGAPAAWDEITHRSRHRRQMRRVRKATLSAVVVGVAVTALVVRADDARVDTGPSVNQPEPTAPKGVLRTEEARIERARGGDTTVTLVFPGLSECGDFEPVVLEEEAQIEVGLVPAQDGGAVPWLSCTHELGGVFGTIELSTALAGRPLIDLATGQPVTVQQGILFPTFLPEPFDVDVVEQRGLQSNMLDWWTFDFPSGEGSQSEGVRLTTSTNLETNDDASASGCSPMYGGTPVEVRGYAGCFTEGEELGEMRGGSLAWDEAGRSFYLSIVSAHVEGSSLDELLAIAEGLEPLDG